VALFFDGADGRVNKAKVFTVAAKAGPQYEYYFKK